MHTQPSSGARCVIFGRTLRLLPYFMCMNSEASGETATMRRLCDKYHNPMGWLIFLSVFVRKKPWWMAYAELMNRNFFFCVSCSYMITGRNLCPLSINQKLTAKSYCLINKQIFSLGNTCKHLTTSMKQ